MRSAAVSKSIVKIMVVGVLLGTLMAPAAQAGPVAWHLEYPGAPSDCTQLPCPVTAKVDDAYGQPVSEIAWDSEDHTTNPDDFSPDHFGSPASWTYEDFGTRAVRLRVRFSEGEDYWEVRFVRVDARPSPELRFVGPYRFTLPATLTFTTQDELVAVGMDPPEFEFRPPAPLLQRSEGSTNGIYTFSGDVLSGPIGRITVNARAYTIGRTHGTNGHWSVVVMARPGDFRQRLVRRPAGARRRGCVVGPRLRLPLTQPMRYRGAVLLEQRRRDRWRLVLGKRRGQSVDAGDRVKSTYVRFNRTLGRYRTGRWRLRYKQVVYSGRTSFYRNRGWRVRRFDPARCR